MVTGDVVVESVLKARFETVQFSFGTFGCSSTEGSTGACPRTMKIHEEVLAAPAVDAKGRSPARDHAYLVGTLAHELTHAVRPASECAARYLDEGFSSCTQNYLVSCRLGVMVRCWNRGARSSGEMNACVDDASPPHECKAIVDELVASCR